ncbi:hypothetical protein [Natronorubrum halophilum]|uniref:hypothetical protein n=1 Tax=Natronorubrum halophilum TaxID=1702106 RepID=UPI0010C183BF|nr:hypothetical protein [Natronorubrum halophilum]
MTDVLDGREETLERLEELARERWGDKWAIKQKHWADGTTSEHAYHMNGPVDVDDVDQKVLESERLWLNDDGQYVVERVQLTAKKAIDREVIADPFDLVDEDQIRWSWVKDGNDRWHRVISVDDQEDGTERTLACGGILKDDGIEEMVSSDPSDQDYETVELCSGCAASRM